MNNRTWQEDMAKLEEEVAKLAAQFDGMSAIERTARAAMLRDGLKREGLQLSADDEKIIQQFSEGHCTFDELAEHFRGRLPSA